MAEAPALPPGFVLDQPAGAPPLPAGFTLDQPSAAGDVAKQLAAGAVIDTLAVPGNMRSLMGGLGDWVGNKLGLPPLSPEQQARLRSPISAPSTPEIERAIQGATGVNLAPQTPAGEKARFVGGFLPAMMGGPETAFAKFGTRVAAPFVGSQIGEQVAQGTGYEPAAKVAGAVLGGLAAGRVGAPKGAVAAIPEGAELKTVAKAGYNAPEVKDVLFKPQLGTDLAKRIENDLYEKGFRNSSQSASGAYEEVSRMAKPNAILDIADLDNSRRALGMMAKEVNPVTGEATSQAAGAALAMNHINDFMPNLRQSDLLRGNAQAANEILKEARGNYKAYAQSKLADTKMENARIQAATTYGGGNINNALRQAYRPLEVNNFAKVSNWSPAAQAALKDVAEGRFVRNALRDIGRSAPTGPVNLGMHTMAAAATGGASLPFAAASYVAKKLGEAGTKSAARRLSETIRKESPLYQGRAGQAAVQNALSPPLQSNPQMLALINALLALRQSGAPSPTSQTIPPFFAK